VEYLQLWWKIFVEKVKPYLDSSVLDDRQHSWETGRVDYMGVDSFENIQRQLDSKIKHPAGETKDAGSKSQDVKPAEVKPAGVKPAEVKLSGVKGAEGKSAEVKPQEVKPQQVKPTQVKTSSISISSGVKPAPK